MANTTRYVGDTGPLKLEVADENGPISGTALTDATARTLLAVGPGTFSGALAVIDPPEVDGPNSWNVEFELVAGDTGTPGTYNLYATFTWADSTVSTFAPATLEIKAKS